MNLSFLIAWRYLLGTSEEKNISTMAKICFLGIVIGSFSLALVVSVMNGFEKVTSEKMQGIHSSIIIRAYGEHLNVEELNKVFAQHIPEVQAAAPSDTQHVMLQHPVSEDVHDVMVLKGIEPAQEAAVSSLENKIVAAVGQKTLSALVIDNQVLIGSAVAQALGISPGETLTLFFAPDEQQGKNMKFKTVEVVVGGTFSTGIDEIDSNVIFCSLDFMTALFSSAGVTQLGLKLVPGADEKKVLATLNHYLAGLEVYSWKDLYPALVSALKLEKYVMFFILALITLVASMNIISLLFMQITTKRGDIAILKAMGCPTHIIERIFIGMGLLLALIATVLGIIAAAGACFVLEHYPFITLPDVYYVTHLPARMEFHLVVAVFVVVMAVSFAALWFPVRQIRRIVVAQVLRFEA